MFNPSDIINSFKESNHDLYNKMNKISHDYSFKYQSKCHSEGSIWTHTCMSLVSIINQLNDKLINNDKELFLSLLFHDIGKVKTIQVKYDDQNIPRLISYGHDGLSTFMALDCIKKMNLSLNKDELKLILKLINHHMIFFNLNNYFNQNDKFNAPIKVDEKIIRQFKNDLITYLNLKIIFKCDNNGRITSINDYFKINQINNYLDYLYKDIELSSNNINHIDKESKNKVIMLVGVPGSGKTTYTQQFISKNKDYKIISRDKLIEDNISNNEYSYRDSFQDKEFQKYISNQLDKNLQDMAYQNQNVIIDMTNTNPKSRKQKLSKFNTNYYKVAEVFIRSYDDLMNTNLNRTDHTIPQSILFNMMKDFKIPLYDEFDEINFHIN